MHEPREQDEYQEPGREHRAEHEARVNQHRHEPIPASSSSDKDQAAAGGNQGQAARRPERSPAPGQGDAVRDMIGEPQPQGDVPDAPATQVATADHEEDQSFRVRNVAHAVPGKPDGEVDTRS